MGLQIPNYIEDGAHNPMGVRALYLYSGGRDTLYRIHGTNQPGWIGHAISSGCIPLTEDVIELYSRSMAATRVQALVEPLGSGRRRRVGAARPGAEPARLRRPLLAVTACAIHGH
jgi:L,D-transpeptidase catalytic domain